MGDTTLTSRVLDALVDAGVLTVEQLAAVRESADDDSAIGAVLVERGMVTAADVGTVLEGEMGIPRVELSSYSPDEDALLRVPAQTARSRRMLPLFEIDGALTVAIGDPMDVFALDGIGAELGLELDPVLAEAAPLLAAIVQHYETAPAQESVELAAPPQAAPTGVPKPVAADKAGLAASLEAFVTSESGMADLELPAAAAYDEEPEPFTTVSTAEAPAADAEPEVEEAIVSETLEQMAATAREKGPTGIDLDVLAVADSTRVALLVAEILADAADKGATRVHLLPYKEDFFLVYRIKGRLEKVGSAPLSLQGPLVDAFKSFAKISGTPSNMPALGRVHGRLADRDLALTVSVVPTIAGQRLVISLSSLRSEPRSLESLGMNEAESRAAHAMMERGRGVLLVTAPAAEGRSSVFYALLAHAAAAGKTVYSVERSIEYEIPAVAQVLVNPGSPIGASAYFGVGMRQDTDVLAIDGLQSLEDIELAVEAASMGRLVVATFAAGGIVEAVRRMLDMGAEPHGLASALTFGIGERLVRVNCPQCSAAADASLLKSLPGLPSGAANMAGAGCPNCANTGFQGVTGIFEVLPFTAQVRAAVARADAAAQIESAAMAAGMRPLLASGAARVAAGNVSAEELDRVLCFSGA